MVLLIIIILIEMFFNLTKFLLKNLDIDLTNSQVNLLQDIAQNKFVTYLFIGGFAASIDVGIFIFLHEWCE